MKTTGSIMTQKSIQMSCFERIKPNATVLSPLFEMYGNIILTSFPGLRIQEPATATQIVVKKARKNSKMYSTRV